MSKEKRSCLVGCHRAAKARGLCVKCYASARSAVKAGKTTWHELVAKGLALESQRAESAFTEALVKAAAAPAGCRTVYGDNCEALGVPRNSSPAMRAKAEAGVKAAEPTLGPWEPDGGELTDSDVRDIAEHERLIKIAGRDPGELCAVMNGCNVAGVNDMIRKRMASKPDIYEPSDYANLSGHPTPQGAQPVLVGIEVPDSAFSPQLTQEPAAPVQAEPPEDGPWGDGGTACGSDCTGCELIDSEDCIGEAAARHALTEPPKDSELKRTVSEFEEAGATVVVLPTEPVTPPEDVIEKVEKKRREEFLETVGAAEERALWDPLRPKEEAPKTEPPEDGLPEGIVVLTEEPVEFTITPKTEPPKDDPLKDAQAEKVMVDAQFQVPASPEPTVYPWENPPIKSE